MVQSLLTNYFVPKARASCCESRRNRRFGFMFHHLQRTCVSVYIYTCICIRSSHSSSWGPEHPLLNHLWLEPWRPFNVLGAPLVLFNVLKGEKEVKGTKGNSVAFYVCRARQNQLVYVYMGGAQRFFRL